MKTLQEGWQKRGMLVIMFMLASLPALTGAPARAQQAMELASKAPAAQDCSADRWTAIAALRSFTVEDLAVGPAGEIYLTGAGVDGDGTRLATARSLDGGETWEWVDWYAPVDESAAGHALFAAADGAVYVLGWEMVAGYQRPILRKSDDGNAGGWWTSFSGDAGWQPGALVGDRTGQVYLALGHGPGVIGWVVQSALAGEGEWTVEDDFRPAEALVYSALPHALALGADGGLVVAGQLDGAPDRWVVRRRPSAGAAFETVDLFRYSETAYGLAPATVTFTQDGRRLVVAGYGVEGDGEDDYLWLVRSAPLAALDNGGAERAWRTESYQSRPARSSFALDSALDASGRVLAVGTADTDRGWGLVVRRSQRGREPWQELLVLPGLSSIWEAQVAVGPDGRYWVAAISEQATVLLSCTP